MSIGLSLIAVACSVLIHLETASCLPRHLGYIQLDAYLEGMTYSSDFDTNLGLASNLLHTFNAFPARQQQEPELAVALAEFCALYEIGNEPTCFLCSQREVAILSTVATRTDAHAWHPYPDSVLTRVESIIHDLSVSHAHTCLSRYIHRYMHFRSSWQSERPNIYADSFAYRVLARANRQTPRDCIDSFLNRNDLDATDDAHAVAYIEGLKRAGSSVGEDQNAAALYNSYLVQPCRLYAERFGPNLFELALFEEQMFRIKQEAYDPGDNDLLLYLMGRATYLICRALINDQQFAARVISQLSNQ